MIRVHTIIGVTLLAVLATGCVNKQRMTEPSRSVGEQLLLSTAIDRALSELDIEAISRLQGVKVYLSDKFLKTIILESFSLFCLC